MKNDAKNECLLFPILGRYVDRIRSGGKRWEYRRRKPARHFLRGFILDLDHPQKVIGEFRPGRILTGTPTAIWRQTWKTGGVFRQEYEAYVGNRTQLTAIEITHPRFYSAMDYFDPVEFWKLSAPPQSFIYVPLPPWPFGDPRGKSYDLFPE